MARWGGLGDFRINKKKKGNVNGGEGLGFKEYKKNRVFCENVNVFENVVRVKNRKSYQYYTHVNFFNV